MKNRIIQLILIAFTAVFTLWIGIVFGSDRLYSMSLAAEAGKISPEKGIAFLDAAMKLTPGDARLHAQKYDLMGQSAKRKAHSEGSAPGALRSADPPPDELTSSRAHELKQDISSGSLGALRSAPPGDLLYERQLQVIARCVDLCPSVASFHYRYAFAMRKVLPRMTTQATMYLLSEFKKASELRPASSAYKKTYEKYYARYGEGK